MEESPYSSAAEIPSRKVTRRVSQEPSHASISSNYTANRSAQMSALLAQRQPRGMQHGGGIPPNALRANAIQTTNTLTPLLSALFLLTLAMAICLLVYMNFGPYFAFLSFLVLTKLGFLRFIRMMLSNLAFLFEDPTSRQELLRRCDARETPETKKTSMGGSYSGVSYGFSCMQGWRRSMEDDHTIIVEPCGERGFFAIFDGHCGCSVATYCGKHLHSFIEKTESFTGGEFPRAIRDGFHAIDKHILKTAPTERSGCTAVTLLITEEKEGGIKKIFCGNAGDSRCIVSRRGKTVELSEDHKPMILCEKTRIEKAGGAVINKRVNGCLALSRAIGDFSFKTNVSIPWEQQAVTCDPEIRSLIIDPDNDEFAVLACDGIWDVMTNDRVIAFVRTGIQNNKPLATICEELMTACLSTSPFGIGCDNMSVIIVTFNRSQLLMNFTAPAIISEKQYKKHENGDSPSTPNVPIIVKEQASPRKRKPTEEIDKIVENVVYKCEEEKRKNGDEPGEEEEIVPLNETMEYKRSSEDGLSPREIPPPIFASSQIDKGKDNGEEDSEMDVGLMSPRTSNNKVPTSFPL